MRIHRTSRAAALLALSILVAACETGTDPDGATDFQSALADYQAMDKAMTSSSWAGFKALGGRTPFNRSAAAIEAVAGLDQPGASFARNLADRLSETYASSTAAGAPIISSTHRGKTLVYNATQDRYVIDPNRAGAPANGTRFILYRVDAAGKPIVGQETGYADLIDLGDGSAQDIALQLKVVAGGATVLDYKTTLDDEPTHGALTVAGFLQGDGVRLDFDIEVASKKTQKPALLDITFELDVDARDFHIDGEVRGVPEGSTGEGSIDLTVEHRDGSFRVDAEAHAGRIEGTFYLNGDVFATISGKTDSPTVLGKTGQPVTGIEALVLQRMWDAAEDVFDFLEDLVDPVDDLVLLGIVL